jgi:hypothetical protein
MKKMLVSWFTGMAIVLSGGAAFADQKNYVWTYDYATLARGGSEVEFYQTAVTKDIQTRNASDWKQQVELEYGITDHLDAALYEMYEQPADGVLSYAGYKLRLRYRIAEKDRLPVDFLLYAEHQENITDENAFEGKLILAKDIGKLNIAYNQIYEREYGPGKEEHGYAVGVSYALAPWFAVGIEAKGSYTDKEYAAGPTLAWVGNRIWANVGAVYGMNRKSNDREVRFLLGVPF